MDTENRHISINISSLTIIKVIVFVLLLGFCYLIRDVLAILFVALILTAAITPWIDWLQKRLMIPRGLGVLTTLLISIGFIALLVVLIIPPVIDEIKQFASHLPDYYQKVFGFYSGLQQNPQGQTLVDYLQNSLQSLGGTLEKATSGVFSTVTGFLSGLVSLVITIVITFYLATSPNGLKRISQSAAIPSKYQPYLTRLIERVQQKMGAWLKGQLILCLIIGLLSYIGLTILGVKFALVLALIAAFTEIIPYVGPLIAGSAAVFIAFVQSPFLAVSVIILYVVIQQLENHLIVPKIMKRAVGLNPVIVIVSIIAGGKIGGITGALIAIPAVTAASVIIKDYLEMRNGNGNHEEQKS